MQKYTDGPADFRLISTLDGNLIETDIPDEEKGSRLAIMGAIIYGSIKTIAASEKDERVVAKLPGELIGIGKKGDRLIIEIFDENTEMKSHLEKP